MHLPVLPRTYLSDNTVLVVTLRIQVAGPPDGQLEKGLEVIAAALRS